MSPSGDIDNHRHHQQSQNSSTIPINSSNTIHPSTNVFTVRPQHQQQDEQTKNPTITTADYYNDHNEEYAESVVSMGTENTNLMLPDWGEDSDNEAKLQAIALAERRRYEEKEEQRRQQELQEESEMFLAQQQEKLLREAKEKEKNQEERQRLMVERERFEREIEEKRKQTEEVLL